MFQYAFAKLLEEQRKIPVYFICKKSDFKLSCFDNVNFIDITLKRFNFIFNIIIRCNFRYLKFHSCLGEIEVNSISNFTLVSGYFQSSRIFEENRNFLRNLFGISNFVSCDLNKCIIHVRGGDYLTTIFEEINSNAILSVDWFKSQMEYLYNINPNLKFVAVSDDSNYLKRLFLNDPIQILPTNHNSFEDFIQLMSSKYLIISNSSFAWWAAFLNIHEDAVIIAPKNWVGFNVNKEYPKGIMTSRFLWK